MFSATHPSPEDCLNILRILGDDEDDKETPYRRVRFNMNHSFTTTLLDDSSSLDDMWYQPQEIFAFRKQARKLLKTRKKNNQGIMMMNCDDEVFRGLECWVLERRLHRHKTIQCTLSAYKKGMSSDVTAQIANRCAAWSREIAFVQASHDYYNVYQPSMASRIPKLSNIPPEFPFTLKPANKSRATVQQDDISTGSSSNRKRRRQRRIL